MKTLRLQLRFLVPLALALVAASYLALPLLDRMTLRWFSRDLNIRGELVANALSDSVGDAMLSRRPERLAPLFDRTIKDERLFAVGLCSPGGQLDQATASFPAVLNCRRSVEIAQQADPRFKIQGGGLHVAVHDIQAVPPVELDPAAEPAQEADGLWSGASGDQAQLLGAVPAIAQPRLVGRLVLLHDLSFIDRRSQDTRHYLIFFMSALGFTIALITMAVAQLSWRGWVNGARAILRGEGLVSPLLPAPELRPLAEDIHARLRELEDEYKRLQGPQADWTPERLRNLLLTQLRGDQVIVVSNREPYIHEHGPNGVIVKRPASGLVTAIEPVMRACSGTWIAHGSGSADRDVVGPGDRIAVPPGHDDYQLKRVWLTPEEEQGYYYGFANEGMWPLCHVAHVRPVFREADWEAYKRVNQRFADAVVAEARGDDPVVLVQDYHFALLPAMIRERLPKATVLTFWHIPWPNPESFGICPWRKEILQGLLGSTILGFHTRFHCRNFMDTVDRYLEARIEQEHSTVTYRDSDSLIESYPISIEWPGSTEPIDWPPIAACRQRVRVRHGLREDACLAVGVDRFDYTKGIVERLNAVERMLEMAPHWIGRFVFIQVAAPSRSALDEYQAFQQRVEHLAQRINVRFGSQGYQPVILLARHHEPAAVNELFRAADICAVTSLHDGMNLVCKEFVAARDDEQGVLVLSRFAGAAREMTEALLVNPYHVEETAQALLQAAEMPASEQRVRMVSLRSTVRENNVYRWAGRMLADAARWRLRARIRARVIAHSSH